MVVASTEQPSTVSPHIVNDCLARINQSALEECVGKGLMFDVCSNKCLRGMEQTLSVLPPWEEPIYGKIFPVLVFFVVIANVMVALVLSKRHMVTPTNVVLKYMAIADLFVGLTPLPWTIFYFTFQNIHHGDQVELWWCYVQKYSMDAFPPVFHNTAMWLTVLLAGQRFISISYPLHSRSLCNVKNVRICTLIISIISVLCNLPKSIDSTLDVFDGYAIKNITAGPTKMKMCLETRTALVQTVGENFYFGTYFYTRSILFVIVPSVLLIGLNAGLIRGIRKAQQRKERLLREKRTRDAQRQNDTNSTSLMLVVIVTIFLIVNLPQALFMFIICIEQLDIFKRDAPILNYESATIFLLINNMLVMATYPINFAIYCFMSSSFRQTFKALFCSIRKSMFRSAATESSLLTERKMDNSAVPLVKIIPDDNTLNTFDENSIYRRDRRNDSVFL